MMSIINEKKFKTIGQYLYIGKWKVITFYYPSISISKQEKSITLSWRYKVLFQYFIEIKKYLVDDSAKKDLLNIGIIIK